MSIGKL